MFNYHYEIASLLFLSIVAWRFFKFRQFPLLSNKIFGIIIVSAGAVISCDLLSIATMRPGFPVAVSYTFNVLYYALLIMIPCALMLYMLAIVSNSRDIEKNLFRIALIPSTVFELVLFIGLPLGLVFSISPDYVYSRGPLASITYICFAVNILITLAMLLYYRRNLASSVKNSYVFLTVISVVCVFLQYMHPAYLLTNLGLTAALTIMYFSIQNPNRMLDSTTDAYNHSAFRMFLDSNNITGGHFNIAAFHIEDLRMVNTLYGIKNADNLLRAYSHSLYTRKAPWVFRLSGSRFVVMTKYDNEIERLSSSPAVFSVTTEDNDVITVNISKFIIRSAEKLDTNVLLNIIENSSGLDRASAASRGTLEVNDEIIEIINRTTRVESMIKESIETGAGFSMHYQLLYSPERNAFVSAESLLRFEHPELGYISPAEFMPAAEDKGLAPKIDEMVVTMVFREIAKGTFDSLNLDNIHVNLSVESFANENLVPHIQKVASLFDISPQFIVFEITETATGCSSDMIRSKMSALKSMGFRFALDDFGTGYASIARQLTLPFTIVKLDKSLLSSRDIFRELVRVLSRLSVTLIAEGIETDEDADFVISCGIDMIQGYYYARPVSPEKLEEIEIEGLRR